MDTWGDIRRHEKFNKIMKIVENQIKQYSCVMCSSIYDGNNATSPIITKYQIDKNKIITKNAKEHCISNNV